MLGLKFGQVIDVFIHNDPEIVRLFVCRHGILGEGTWHPDRDGRRAKEVGVDKIRLRLA